MEIGLEIIGGVGGEKSIFDVDFVTTPDGAIIGILGSYLLIGFEGTLGIFDGNFTSFPNLANLSFSGESKNSNAFRATAFSASFLLLYSMSVSKVRSKIWSLHLKNGFPLGLAGSGTDWCLKELKKILIYSTTKKDIDNLLLDASYSSVNID